MDPSMFHMLKANKRKKLTTGKKSKRFYQNSKFNPNCGRIKFSHNVKVVHEEPRDVSMHFRSAQVSPVRNAECTPGITATRRTVSFLPECTHIPNDTSGDRDLHNATRNISDFSDAIRENIPTDVSQDILNTNFITQFDESPNLPIDNQGNLNQTSQFDVQDETTQSHLGVTIRTAQDHAEYDILKILKDLLRNLENGGKLEDFVVLCQVIANGKLNPENIALSLAFDLGRFCNLSSTTGMHYPPLSLSFWRFLYTLCGSTVIKAFSGPKNLWQIVQNETTRGHYDPVNSKFNFAVPSESLLRKSDGYIPKHVPPGIIKSTLDEFQDKASDGCEVTLTFDGKSVGTGVCGRDKGDINLWGLEGPPSVQLSLAQLDTQLKLAQRISTKVTNDFEKCKRIEDLRKLWHDISRRIKRLRIKVKEQNVLRDRLIKMSENHPEGLERFKYGLSKVNARINVCSNAIKRSLDFVNSIVACVAECAGGGQLVATGLTVNVSNQKNYYRLLPPELVSLHTDLSTNTHLVKQGSDMWMKLRDLARITGSTVHSALGLRSLKEQKEHHYEKVKGRQALAVPDDLQAKFDYGKENEINAVATIVSLFLPALKPVCHQFLEVGTYFMDSVKREKLFAVSPDGLVKCTMGGDACPYKFQHKDSNAVGIEIKCPYGENGVCDNPHYELPTYYVGQVLMEMAVMGVEELWYVSWTPKSSTLIHVRFDQQLFDKMFHLGEILYGEEKVNVPTRLHTTTKELRLDLKSFVRTNSTFVAEVQSVYASHTDLTLHDELSPYTMIPVLHNEEYTFDQLNLDSCDLSTEAETILTDLHSTCRNEASEVGVFMLNDSDRIFQPGKSNCGPMAYIMKGPAMSVNQLRYLVDICRNELSQRGIPILSEVYDGQWAKIVFEDCAGNPLTLLQLQKKSWEVVKRKSKSNILNLICDACGVSSAECDLIRFHPYFPGGSTCVGNIEIVRDALTRSLELSSRGGSLSSRGFMEYIASIPLVSTLWMDSTPDPTSARNTNSTVVGLRAEEKNMLPLLPVDLQKTIIYMSDELGEEELPDLVLGRYLNDEGINILRDIKNELSERNDLWVALTECDLYSRVLKNAENLSKLATIPDLKIIASILRHYTQRAWITHKMKKGEMINSIVSAFGSTELLNVPSEIPKDAPVMDSLKNLARKVIMQDFYPVMCLRVPVANALHINNKIDFMLRSNVEMVYKLPVSERVYESYSIPEYSFQRQQNESRTLDASHMLGNLRSACTRNDGIGLANSQAWKQVADRNPEILSRSIVYDNIDCQNVVYSKRFFSHAVEEQMRQNGDMREADFVNTVRKWYMCCDQRGITATYRIEGLVDMHELLTQDVDFDSFPAPEGSHIKGISNVTYEAILQNICTRIQLYGLSRKGTYNQRSVSTLTNESFFSDLVSLDKENLGTPKAANVGRLLSKVCMLNRFKNDPNKGFHYYTSSKRKYPVQIVLPWEESLAQEDRNEFFKDHFFDNIDMHNPSSRRRKEDITMGNAPLRGVQGIRQLHYKVNEQLILPETRQGFAARGLDAFVNDDANWLNFDEEMV